MQKSSNRSYLACCDERIDDPNPSPWSWLLAAALCVSLFTLSAGSARLTSSPTASPTPGEKKDLMRFALEMCLVCRRSQVAMQEASKRLVSLVWWPDPSWSSETFLLTLSACCHAVRHALCLFSGIYSTNHVAVGFSNARWGRPWRGLLSAGPGAGCQLYRNHGSVSARLFLTIGLITRKLRLDRIALLPRRSCHYAPSAGSSGLTWSPTAAPSPGEEHFALGRFCYWSGADEETTEWFQSRLLWPED